MAWLLRMPEVAADALEAVLSQWLVEQGGAFTAQTALATVETDKAVVDIESDTDGVLLATLVPNNTKVEVGAPIAVLGEPAEKVDDMDEVMARLGVTDAGVAVTPDSEAQGLSGAEDGVPQPEAPSAGPGASPGRPEDAATEQQGERSPDDRADGRIFSSPLARRLALEAGLDLATLQGSGPRGRILRRDVDRARAEQAAEPAPSVPRVATHPQGGAARPSAAAGAGITDVPHSRMRRAIAHRLTQSKQTVPHFSVRATLDVADLLDLRDQLNEALPAKVSVTDLILKAAAAAHQLVPEMNVAWTDDAVRHFDTVDVSLAVATEGGLVTPVVRGVETLTVAALSARTRDLADRARAGQLRQGELEGGTLSVTNLGMYGAEEFTAIINPPQSAILAVGAARQEPVVRDGQLCVGTVMRANLSVDHRPIDGVVAARWMRAFTTLVQHPVRILA